MRPGEMLVLSLRLGALGLKFTSPDAWSFTGTVIETRRVILLGQPAQVARILSKDFDAWVVLYIETGSFNVRLGSAQPGDQVRVSIQGSHVSERGVDWSLYKEADANTGHLGNLYEAGPLSPVWKTPLSPSNEFIHCGHPNPSWEKALFWKTEKLVLDEDKPDSLQPACLPDPRERNGVAAWCYAQAAHSFALELRPMVRPLYRTWLKDQSYGVLKGDTSEELYNWLNRLHPWDAKSTYNAMLVEIAWLLNMTCDFFNFLHETTP